MDSDLNNDWDKSYKPIILSPIVPDHAKTLENLKKNPILQIIDTIEQQIGELIKINNPTLQFTEEQLTEEINAYFSVNEREKTGNWVFYPWRRCVLKVLEEADFVKLRTSRNRYKITQEEQDKLNKKKIGVIGLSVGQSVSLSLAMERGFGELRIADFDTLDLSNMNRIRTGLENIGLKKTWIVAREIAEIDPYLKLTLYDEGITEGNIQDFFTAGGHLDLLIEECDSLAFKILARIKAKSLGIPVLMDTSDKGMIDIERFDIEPDRPIFHGYLKHFGKEESLLAQLGQKHKEVMASVLDFDNLSERAKYSIAEIGKTITTWPQLASSVIIGGAACSHFARMLLLGQKVNSGRCFIDLDKLIGTNEG